MTTLAERLRESVAGSALEEAAAANVVPLAEERGADRAAAEIAGPALSGLARVVASEASAASFISHRPALFERVARIEAGSLEARARELEAKPPPVSLDDLEGSLDTLRLARREETCFAACCDLGGLAPFDEVSSFLSSVAEAITRQALSLASAVAKRSALAVIGMGKIAGREFTYHSDLDLIFLYEGGPEEISDASRIGQRLISYLTTMTGAGIAYPVDTRLRPSGGQGMLVTSCDAFERYQCGEAQTWEHLAMLRARAIAGSAAGAQATLDRARERVLAETECPWEDLVPLRRRVETERASDSEQTVSFKTGPGGLMDVDFLAGGGLLERGTADFPKIPSVPSMLRACAGGKRVEKILADYRFLRIVEARARWVTGRPVEALRADAQLGVVAELVEPGLAPQTLLDDVVAARSRIRAAWDEVISARSIRAIES